MNMILALCILDRPRACGAITSQSLLLSAKFGIEVAARRVAIFTAQCVEPCESGFRHAGIELHFRVFTLLVPPFRERQSLGGQFKIAPIRFEFGAAPGIAHSVLEIGRGTPYPPPQCL